MADIESATPNTEATTGGGPSWQQRLRFLNPLPVPSFTRLIATFVVLLFVLSLVPFLPLGKFFGLVPVLLAWVSVNYLEFPVSQTILLGFIAMTISRFFIWNILTCAFYQAHFVDVIANVYLFLLGGKYLEPFWGKSEFLKFIAVVGSLSGVSTFLAFLLIFFATGDEEYWFPTVPYGGFGGVIAGFAVALKQLIPEYELSFSAVSFRAKQIPLILLGIHSLLFILRIPATTITFVVAGWIWSWVYLRFFQKREGGVTGDSSDSFQFATFFPEPMQPVLIVIGNIVWNWCCCCVRRRAPSGGSGDGSSSTSLSGSTAFPSVLDAPQDVERRRQLGLKALDQRMAHLKSATPQSPIPVSKPKDTPPSTPGGDQP